MSNFADGEFGASQIADCRSWLWDCKMSPWAAFSCSGHRPSVVREFCSVKYDSLGSVCLCRCRYVCAVDAAGDSRLRGNDVGGCGNDVSGYGDGVSGYGDGVGGYGNDVSGYGYGVSGCGYGVSGCGNDVGGCGNDVGGYGDDGCRTDFTMWGQPATRPAKSNGAQGQRIIDYRPKLVLSYLLYGERGQVG